MRQADPAIRPEASLAPTARNLDVRTANLPGGGVYVGTAHADDLEPIEFRVGTSELMVMIDKWRHKDGCRNTSSKPVRKQSLLLCSASAALVANIARLLTRFPLTVAHQRSDPYSPRYHQHRARPCRQGHAASCRTRSSDGRSQSWTGLSVAPISLFAEFVPPGQSYDLPDEAPLLLCLPAAS